MRTSHPFRKFIELQQNFPQSEMHDALKIGQIPDFSKGVRDFIYLPQYNSAFVATSDMNIVTRLDSYFTNISMPWEKKKDKDKKKEEAASTVGALQHYKIIETPG